MIPAVVPDYLLIGHATADLTADGRMLGGTVSYASRVAAAFGLRVGVLTSADPDEPLLDELRPFVHELIVRPAQSTSTFENIYTPDGRVQYIRGVAAPITSADIPPAWFAAPLVHLAPLTGEVDPQIAHVFPNALRMLTLQGWLRQWDADGRVHFKRWYDPAVLASLDIVVFSEEDIVESPDLEALFAQTVRHLFVTRAERGGTYYHHGQPTHYETPEVVQVHPTGAGDIFAASLLAGLHQLGGDMPAAIRVAAALAAHSVTRVGLESAPAPAEVQRYLTEAKRYASG